MEEESEPNTDHKSWCSSPGKAGLPPRAPAGHSGASAGWRSRSSRIPNLRLLREGREELRMAGKDAGVTLIVLVIGVKIKLNRYVITDPNIMTTYGPADKDEAD